MRSSFRVGEAILSTDAEVIDIVKRIHLIGKRNRAATPVSPRHTPRKNALYRENVESVRKPRNVIEPFHERNNAAEGHHTFVIKTREFVHKINHGVIYTRNKQTWFISFKYL